MDRRTLLATTGTALAAALAGCTGGGDGATTETTTAAPTTAASTGGEQTTERQTTATETMTATETATPTTAAATTGGGGDATVVTVAPGGDTSFDPDRVTVAAGTTVRWEWAAGSHNVRPAAQPDGADWTGTDGGNSGTYGEGHVYEHQFDVTGTYEYYCAPHRSIGMTGVVVVE